MLEGNDINDAIVCDTFVDANKESKEKKDNAKINEIKAKIIVSLDSNKEINHSDAIVDVVKDLTDEEYELFLQEFPSIALAFINPEMSESIASLVDNTITSNRARIRAHRK